MNKKIKLPPVSCHTKDLDEQYTLEQMVQYASETRRQALEEAAACAYDEVQYMSDFDKADIVSAQIRALIGAKT